jgi:hypothetical protein
VDHLETDEQLAARYANYLKFSIQDELSMHRVRSMEEAYKLDLKGKEKINQQFYQRNRRERSTSSASWGGFNYGRGETSEGSMKAEDTPQCNLNQTQGRGFHRGIGYGGGIVLEYRILCSFYH